MREIYTGIDNGSTGSIAVISDLFAGMIQTPVKKELSYTKKVQYVTRIDVVQLQEFFLEQMVAHNSDPEHVHIALERPMVNPKMFKASMSAMRAYEATINVFELMGLGYDTVDSKGFQKALLPTGIKGSAELKKASAQIGKRLYPHLSDIIDKQKDGDSICIAHWLMMKYK